MPLRTAELVWTREGLDGPVQVDWGIITGERPDLVAAAGTNVYVFSPSDAGYFPITVIDTGETVLSLVVGLPLLATDNIFVGLADRVIFYGRSQGTVDKLGETGLEPDARFVDLALGDLDGDGREELIAASEGKNALYFYRLTGEVDEELRLEILAIRALPGSARRVAVLERGEGQTPIVAAAYDTNATSGLLTLIYTERGFVEGPSLEDLGVSVTSMSAGNLTVSPEEELAWGGDDGAVRIVEVNQLLNTVLTTVNLGSAVTAVTTGRLAGAINETLIAGTPEGFLFGFEFPVEKNRPDWVVSTGRSVNDLALSTEGLLGVGTTDGGVLVWRLLTGESLVHTVQPGETLSVLAERYQTTVAAIAEKNNISDPDLIYPGQNVIIP